MAWFWQVRPEIKEFIDQVVCNASCVDGLSATIGFGLNGQTVYAADDWTQAERRYWYRSLSAGARARTLEFIAEQRKTKPAE